MIAPFQNPEAEKGLFRRPFGKARHYLAQTFFEQKRWYSGGRSVRLPVAWGFAVWVAFASAFYVGAMLGWW